MQSIRLNLGMYRKHNFEFFGFKCDVRSSLEFFFSLSLLPSSFTFFCIIILFRWAFSELHFGGESLKLLGLEERKGSGTRF